MFVRVSTIQGKSEQIEKGIREYREQVLPAASRMSGFKGALLMVDRKSGKLLGISLWNSEKDLQASTAVTDKLRAQASRDVSGSKPQIVEIYEVALQA